MLLSGLGSVRMVKNCDLGLENFQDLGHSFSLYGPPSQANNIHVKAKLRK